MRHSAIAYRLSRPADVVNKITPADIAAITLEHWPV
jgi:hypothetical protein